jgi:hypothetical protein
VTDPLIGFRHNPCRTCGRQVTTPSGLLCLDCVCAALDAAGLTMRDIAPAIEDFGAADGQKTSSSNVGHQAGQVDGRVRAIELLRRIDKYVTEDKAVTPGCTRLARVLVETRKFLDEHDARKARR